MEKQSWISNEIIEKVNIHLKKKDQILFFLNRRGFSPNVLCKKCYDSFSCPNCSINLVYHKRKGIVKKMENVNLYLVVQV